MKTREGFIVSVVGRVTVFLFIFTMFILILYIQGSFQDFLDRSLINLLILFRYSTLSFLALAVSYVFILLVAGKNTGRRVVKRIILTITGIVLSSAFLLIVEIIITGLEPVS